MSTVRVSASILDRVARCNASAALPQVVDENDEGNEARERGKGVHAFLERCAAVGRDVALAEVDDSIRAICEDIELARLASQLAMSQEVPLAYNWREDSARRLEPDEFGRVMVDRSCEIAVRIDVVGHNAARRHVYSGDYKTGSSWLPDPAQSWQLGLGALAAARLLRARSATVEYIRIRDDGTVRKFHADIDMLGLDAAATKIASVLEQTHALRLRVLEGLVPNVTEGPWCRYCNARYHCPAKTAIIRHVIGDAQPVSYVLPLTPEGAARAYPMLKVAKAAIVQIESALYSFAKVSPIPVGIDEDGSERWFGELTRDGNEQFDGAVAHQVVSEIYGGEIANLVVSMETTKRALSDEVRKHLVEGETLKNKLESIYVEIRTRGGAHRKKTTTTTEYTISPEGTAKARRRRAAD